MRNFIFLLNVFASMCFGRSASEYEEADNMCNPIIIPEKKLAELTYLPQKFKEILQNYTESRNHKFKQVLTEQHKYGFDSDTIDKIGSTETLESFVLFHQMNLHRDVISKIEEARYILQNITEKTIIHPEKKLEELTYLQQKFKEILQNYTESRNHKFKQVLTEQHRFDKDTIDKIGSTETLESFVLFHQMNLHRDVILKIEEARYIPKNITEQSKPSIGGEEKLLDNLSLKLQDLLTNNFESRNQKLKNVLLNSGFDRDEIGQLDPNEPMEGFILRHQINLHQEMKSMLKEIKELLEFQNQQSKCLKEKPTDCCDLYLSGKNRSGIYQIYPISDPVEVYCDMETHGGGWTVFLSRGDQFPMLNFNRSWMDYKVGFGRAAAEYWLGNELLSWLTQNRNYSIRMDGKYDFSGEIWGEWGTFNVDSELSKYQLTISDFDPRSTADDTLTYFNGMKFSSFDSDNDRYEGNCASRWQGGWWYEKCRNNFIDPTEIHSGYVYWLQLKIRPKICS